MGASPWRLRRTQELLHLWTPSILRVNLGEAQALLAMNSREQGVDSPGPVSYTHLDVYKRQVEALLRLMRALST